MSEAPRLHVVESMKASGATDATELLAGLLGDYIDIAETLAAGMPVVVTDHLRLPPGFSGFVLRAHLDRISDKSPRIQLRHDSQMKTVHVDGFYACIDSQGAATVECMLHALLMEAQDLREERQMPRWIYSGFRHQLRKLTRELIANFGGTAAADVDSTQQA